MASDVCNSKIRGGNTLSPNPSPLMERGTDPLELIAEGRQSIDAICCASKMSILELAAHVCTAQNLETLARVKLLHATQREMLLGRLKRDALVRLAELTDEVPSGSADEIRAFEVMRRACVDILRFGNGPTRSESDKGPGGGGPRGYPGEYPGGGYHPDSITPAFEAEVLEALERLGQEDEEQEEEVYPQITQIAQMNSGGFKSGSKNRGEPRARASGAVELPLSIATPESHLSHGPISRNGPGAGDSGSLCEEPGADASGSLGKCTGKMLGSPAPPHDGSIGQGQSRLCPCHPAGGHQKHAGPGTQHGIVGLDHGHPP